MLLILNGVVSSAQTSTHSSSDFNHDQPHSNDIPASFTSQPVNVKSVIQQAVVREVKETSYVPASNSTSSLSKNEKFRTTGDDTSNAAKEIDNGFIGELLGDEVTSYIATGVALLGAALGRRECDLKAACLAGFLFPAIQGRDIAMVALEPLIPDDWKEIYLAAKSSMIQGQNCSQFNCF